MTGQMRDPAEVLNDPVDRQWDSHWLNRLVERIGLPVVIVGFTLVSMTLSASVATAGSILLGWKLELVRALLIPALVTPPMSAWTVRVVHMMGKLSQRNHEIATAYRALAMSDQLTGLLNRRGLFGSLLTLDPTASVVLGIADVDRFKQINDMHGHDVGDQALIQVADQLLLLAGPQDIVARTGGDEFVLVLHRDSAAGLPEKLQVGCPGPTLMVSLGWERLDPGNVDAALREADAKMYRSKSSDPATVVVPI